MGAAQTGQGRHATTVTYVCKLAVACLAALLAGRWLARWEATSLPGALLLDSSAQLVPGRTDREGKYTYKWVHAPDQV
jgi:hypothetical protein